MALVEIPDIFFILCVAIVPRAGLELLLLIGNKFLFMIEAFYIHAQL